jgi:predicted 3-demethylubiquinone-9 3-methyltransferase (glyoxalase superfamily)
MPAVRIVPCALFVGGRCGQARSAIEHYRTVFSSSTEPTLQPYGPGADPDAPDSLMYGEFEIAGQLFTAMDSAHEHNFDSSEGVSFIVNCEDQEEVDRYWSALSTAPESEQCGWLKDRFGISWQVVPRALYRLMDTEDTERRERVMSAMLAMKKIEIEGLERAANG